MRAVRIVRITPQVCIYRVGSVYAVSTGGMRLMRQRSMSASRYRGYVTALSGHPDRQRYRTNSHLWHLGVHRY